MATILPTKITAIDGENYQLTASDGRTYELPLGTEIEEGMILKVDNFTFLKITDTALVTVAVTSNSQDENAENSYENPSENPVTQKNINRGKKWFSNSIKCLLAPYKEHQHLFKANNVKADDVWERIRLLMEESDVYFSAEQIKTKFSKLKQTYYKVKDNNNRTGASPMDFSYMEEFEELFGRSHAVQPVAVASSSQVRPLQQVSDDEDKTVIPKKRRLNSSQMILKNLETLQKRKEERYKEKDDKKSQERHQLLKAIEESNALYKNFMEKLLEKL